MQRTADSRVGEKQGKSNGAEKKALTFLTAAAVIVLILLYRIDRIMAAFALFPLPSLLVLARAMIRRPGLMVGGGKPAMQGEKHYVERTMRWWKEKQNKTNSSPLSMV